MKINANLFAVAGTIYQGIIEAPSNRFPHGQEHAHKARALAEQLLEKCGGNVPYAMAAAKAMCGFMKNPTSAHAVPQEMLHLSLVAAAQLADAFRGTVTPEIVAPPAFIQPPNPLQGPPVMPSAPVAVPVAMPVPPSPPMQYPDSPPAPAYVLPAVPVNVPDFSEDK